MRQLATALVSIGLVLGALVALVPTSVAVPPWEDGSCGPPVVRYFAHESVDDPNAQETIDRCEDVAAGRVVVAGLLATAGVIAGLLALMAAWRDEARARRRKAQRRRQRFDEARLPATIVAIPVPADAPPDQVSS